MKTSKQKIGGFTLVEVLVAMVVLAVGLLGLAGMQMVGMRSGSGASYRSQAAALASDMAERMRANRDAVIPANFDGADSNTQACGALPFDCTALSCNPAQMAAFDINVVSCGDLYGGQRSGGVRNLLPQGRLRITCNACGTADPYDITVSWNELQADGTPAATRDVSVSINP